MKLINVIEEFSGEYRWLSNFEPCKIVFQGIEYPSVEHAYQSAKSDNADWKKECSNVNASAGYIKTKGKTVPLKSNWTDVKIDVMKECLLQKYTQQPYKNKLIETGDTYIQEGNYWNDKFWGVCLKTHKGYNFLGLIIMEIRSQLIKNNM